jgi:hypothetical protein
MDSLEELFCQIDDFCQVFEPAWHKTLIAGGQQRERQRSLCLSEVMTIMITFHQKHYRNFKAFYQELDTPCSKETGILASS